MIISVRNMPLVLIYSSVLMFSGCSKAFLDTSSFGVFQKTEVNLTNRSYIAADYLVGQANTFIGENDLVKATTLADGDEANTYSKIGRIISEQVGVRLSQLGYRMDLSEVSNDRAINYLKPAIHANEKPAFVLSGTCLRRRLEMDVSLRIVDTRSHRIIAVFDYSLPMNREIAELSEPETRIFKVTD